MKRLLVGFVLLLGHVVHAAAGQTDPIAEDEQALKRAGVDTSSEGLLSLLRSQEAPKLSASERAEAAQRIAQIADKSPKTQMEARARLKALGPAVRPLVKEAIAKTRDPAVAVRLRQCLKELGEPRDEENLSAALRLIAFRQTDGAIPVVAALCARAPETGEREAALVALAALARRDASVHPVLLQLLKHPEPSQRAAAGEALCRAGGLREASRVHFLLKDPDLTVRARVATALADVRDSAAVPVLIALLTELPQERAVEAESTLREIAGETAPAQRLGASSRTRRQCQQAWETWWKSINGAALVQALRRAVPASNDRGRIASLVTQLGDDDYAVREQASAELRQGGPVAVSILKQATQNADAEVAQRARECLQELEKVAGNNVPPAAPRLLALSRPPGAAEAILAYLPFAEAGIMQESCEDALRALASDEDGRASLRKGLHDPSPLRKIAAALALCRAGYDFAEVGQLLSDSDPSVRWAVAQALGERGERRAVPVLIGLLQDLPRDQVWEVREFLERLAGPQAPSLDADAAPKALATAWTKWWDAHGAAADLRRLQTGPRVLGFTLVVELDLMGPGTGRVSEIAGRDNRKRWEIAGLGLPVDAQIVAGGQHVLIAEYQAGKVSERDFKGKVLWEKAVPMPINVQRLPNGSTFVATRQELYEIDRAGRETTLKHPRGSFFMAARKLANGQVAAINHNGMLVRFDAEGKEVGATATGITGLGALETLPNGHVLVVPNNQGKVIELDSEGKSVWETNAAGAMSATRALNGHTIIASQGSQKVIEVDRSGKTVWEYQVEGRPWRARRR